MLVLFKRPWFAPDGVLYPETPEGTEVPKALENSLPSSAKVLGKKLVIAKIAPPATLREADPERALAEATDKVVEAAEKTRLANAERLKTALAKEKKSN